MDDQQAIASVLSHLGAVGDLRRHLVPQATARVAVLAALERHGEMRVVELAEHLLVDMSAVSRQLSHAQQDGQVARRPNPADGRSCLVSVTAEGRRLVAEARRQSAEQLTRATAGWDRAELATFAELVGRLHHDLERLPRAAPPAAAPS
ncbi:MarR family winged helix-turn-helix transcriptional regulator [Kitasatospora sp. NPDC057223]|uniref:MarR family winged helix-turn-helix transcriptional regulator n=1 Tax=Kitasatospora sp. NPDC057223 TaxID=3346055 RepID=UPI00363B3DF0